MEGLIAEYLELIGGWKVISILVLIIIDTLLGITLAVFKTKDFAWSKIANFLNSSVLMMFGAYFILGIAAMAESSFKVSVPIVMGIISVKLIADIVTKFKSFGIDINSKK